MVWWIDLAIGLKVLARAVFGTSLSDFCEGTKIRTTYGFVKINFCVLSAFACSTRKSVRQCGLLVGIISRVDPQYCTALGEYRTGPPYLAPGIVSLTQPFSVNRGGCSIMWAILTAGEAWRDMICFNTAWSRQWCGIYRLQHPGAPSHYVYMPCSTVLCWKQYCMTCSIVVSLIHGVCWCVIAFIAWSRISLKTHHFLRNSNLETHSEMGYILQLSVRVDGRQDQLRISIGNLFSHLSLLYRTKNLSVIWALFFILHVRPIKQHLTSFVRLATVRSIGQPSHKILSELHKICQCFQVAGMRSLNMSTTSMYFSSSTSDKAG